MVIHPENATAPRRSSMTWSALKGERLILQAPPAPLRQLIDEHLTRAGVDARSAMVLNRLDTLIAMVEAGEGIGIVPSSTLPVCRYRHVAMARLVNPVVAVDFYQIETAAGGCLRPPTNSQHSCKAISPAGQDAPVCHSRLDARNAYGRRVASAFVPAANGTPLRSE